MMVQMDAKHSVWYRTYVLVILLLVCMSNLASRNQLSYLVTVPVPFCEQVCAGQDIGPTCASDAAAFKYKDKTDDEMSKREQCQRCQMQPISWKSTMQRKPPPFTDLHSPPYAHFGDGWKPVKKPKESDLVQANSHVERSYKKHGHVEYVFLGLSDEVRARKPVSDGKGQSSDVARTPAAAYYNMADGACLYYSQYGLLIGLGFALVFAIVTLPAGYVCDRSPRVRIATLALVAWSVATSMQASADNFGGLLACRAVLGLAQAFGTPATVSLAVDYFSSSQRERDTVVAMLTMVGPQFGAGCASFSIIFSELMGYKWVLLLTGVSSIALAAVLFLTVKEPDRTEFTAPCAANVVIDEVFGKSRVARLLIGAASAKMLASFSLAAFLPIWFSRAGLQGYSNNTYAYWNAACVSSGGLLSALLGAALGQIWGHRDTRAPCFIGLIGAFVSIPLTVLMLTSSSFEMPLICYFVLLVLGECWFGPTMALAQMAVRQSVSGQAVSMLLAISTLAGNLGPAAVGLFDPGGNGIGAKLLWICVTAQICAMVAFYLAAHEIRLDPIAASLGSLHAGRTYSEGYDKAEY